MAVTELAPISPQAEQAQEQEALVANLHKLAALGFMGINVKQQYGGAEAGVIAFSVAMTEIARVCASTAISVSINNLACEIIQAIGSEAQKQAHIPRICRGEYCAGIIGLSRRCARSAERCIRAEGGRAVPPQRFAPHRADAQCWCLYCLGGYRRRSLPLSPGCQLFLIERNTGDGVDGGDGIGPSRHARYQPPGV